MSGSTEMAMVDRDLAARAMALIDSGSADPVDAVRRKRIVAYARMLGRDDIERFPLAQARIAAYVGEAREACDKLYQSLLASPLTETARMAREVVLRWQSGPYTFYDSSGDAIELGTFQMELRLQADGEYLVNAIADAPNSPVAKLRVTHPNVLENRLCQGEARHDIRRAIRSYNIDLAIAIIDQVMATGHMSENPYCSIEAWLGAPCPGCGVRSEHHECVDCEVRLCEDCLIDTPWGFVCSDCVATCPGCDSQQFPASRGWSCPCCDASLCPGCAPHYEE